jgi:hypothetical protein
MPHEVSHWCWCSHVGQNIQPQTAGSSSTMRWQVFQQSGYMKQTDSVDDVVVLLLVLVKEMVECVVVSDPE